MKESPRKVMAVSQSPEGNVFITACLLPQSVLQFPPEDFACCSDAVVTEFLPQTEAGLSDFVRRHGGHPLHPTLASYPAGR